MANKSLNIIKGNTKSGLKNVLENGDLINRSIGQRNSYDSITTLLKSLGHKPVSLMGFDYTYIFDHVRRIYNNKRFTFYGDKPTVYFADVDRDVENLKDWVKSFSATSTNTKETTTYYSESEDDVNQNRAIVTTQANAGVWHSGLVESFNGRTDKLSQNELLKKTNDNFTAGKYRTLVARFHTNSDDSKDESNPVQTAISKKYGMSHGRNLLKRVPTSSYGYDNPYCRVWTYHHQYHTLIDGIRPFVEDDDSEDTSKISQSTLESKYNWAAFRSPSTSYDNGTGDKFGTGGERLDKYGTLNRLNGLPNIAPVVSVSDYNNEISTAANKVRLEQCMFSIENLAWKDTFKQSEIKKFEDNGLSPEQKGPFGGRIMWFPPYNIKFDESVNVDWGETAFIGRGEKIYTYANTERTGNLSFTLLIDHPSIIDYWEHGLRGDGNKAEDSSKSGVDDIDSHEQQMLRFFAGCEVLKAGKFREPEPDPAQANPAVGSPSPDTPPNPEDKKLYCLIYYPNNYSGISDAPGTNSVVNAYDYLINGLGTQMFKTKSSGKPERPFDNLPSDVAVDVLSEYGVGYEMNKPRRAGLNSGKNTGISIFGKNIEPRTPQNFKNSEDMLFDASKYKTSVDNSEDAFIDYKVSGDDRTYYAAMEVLPNSKANKVKWGDKDYGYDSGTMAGSVMKAQWYAVVDAKGYSTSTDVEYTVTINGNKTYKFNLEDAGDGKSLQYYTGGSSKEDATFIAKLNPDEGIMAILYVDNITGATISYGSIRHDLTREELNGLGSKYKMLGTINNIKMPASGRVSLAYNGKRYDNITVKKNNKGRKYLITPDEKVKVYLDNGKVYVRMGNNLQSINIIPIKYEKGIGSTVLEWQHRRWWYRVDKTDDVINQRLVDIETGVSMWDNYVDKKSHSLNSVGYKKTPEAGLFGLTEKDEIVSFADMYVGLHNDSKITEFYKNCVDDEGLSKVKDLMKGKYNITQIEYRGHASIHGDNKSDSVNFERNTKLATQRADTAKAWFSSFKSPFQELAKSGANNTKTNIQTTPKHIANNDVDDILIKQWRSAAIIIHYRDALTVDSQDSMTNTPKILKDSELPKLDNEEGSDWTILGKKDSNGNITEYSCNDIFIMRCGSHYWNNFSSRPKEAYNRLSVDLWLNDTSNQEQLIKLYGNGVNGKDCTGTIDNFSDENKSKIRGWIRDAYRTANLNSNTNNDSHVYKKEELESKETNNIASENRGSTIGNGVKEIDVTNQETFNKAFAYRYYNDYNFYPEEVIRRPEVFNFDDVYKWGNAHRTDFEKEYGNKYVYYEPWFLQYVDLFYKTNGNQAIVTNNDEFSKLIKKVYLSEETSNTMYNKYDYNTLRDYAIKYCSYPRVYDRVRKELSKSVGLRYLEDYGNKKINIGDNFKYSTIALDVVGLLKTSSNSTEIAKKYSIEEVKGIYEIYKKGIDGLGCGDTDPYLDILLEVINLQSNPSFIKTNADGSKEKVFTSMSEVTSRMTDDECKAKVMAIVEKGQITPDQAWKMYEKCLGDKSNKGSNKSNNGEMTNYPRYDNEGEFFKLLKLNDPTMHNLISEKVKYFDPAFHSVSPEGFNARLTFLHQCTRQGPTIGASDVNQTNRIANNLAFGRPPVCILRIGDFYYTKIVIKSISIQYDPVQWDLNQEGIGVMPMFADVSMSFNFLGGSGLSGPIARLQNAVSFNYYANTEVYDNRSEQAEYSNGKLTYFKPFEVNYNLPVVENTAITDENDEAASQDAKVVEKAEAKPVNAKAVNAKAVDAKAGHSSRKKTGSSHRNKASHSTVRSNNSSNETVNSVNSSQTAFSIKQKTSNSSSRSSNNGRKICKYIRYGISYPLGLLGKGMNVLATNDEKNPITWSGDKGITNIEDLYREQKKRLEHSMLNLGKDMYKPDFMFIAYIYYYDKKTMQILHATKWASRINGDNKWYCYGSRNVTIGGSSTPPLIDKDGYKFNNYEYCNENRTRQNIPVDLLSQNIYLDNSGRGRIYKK